MSVQAFDPSAAVVEISDSAAQHFRTQLAQHATAKAIRLSLKQAGCTGWKYIVDLVDDVDPNDVSIDLGEGYQLNVDPKAVGVVSGTRIDYVTQGVNHNLVFNNPHVTDYCGCGESFNVEP